MWDWMSRKADTVRIRRSDADMLYSKNPHRCATSVSFQSPPRASVCVCLCVCACVLKQLSTQASKTIQRTGRPQSLPPYEYVSFQKPWSISAGWDSKLRSPNLTHPPNPAPFPTPRTITMSCMEKKTEICSGSTALQHLRIYWKTFNSRCGWIAFPGIFSFFASERIYSFVALRRRKKTATASLKFWIDELQCVFVIQFKVKCIHLALYLETGRGMCDL